MTLQKGSPVPYVFYKKVEADRSVDRTYKTKNLLKIVGQAWAILRMVPEEDRGSPLSIGLVQHHRFVSLGCGGKSSPFQLHDTVTG